MPEAPRSVFISYASQDAEAAQRITEALREACVEVWFDRSELRGGDAWDATIRRQIKECTLFMPLISGTTQARPEGYFRLEWRFADQRTHLMGRSKPFLVPVCIDNTRESEADVPDSFLAVQWTRLAGGVPDATFCQRVRQLLEPTSATRVPVPDATTKPDTEVSRTSLPPRRLSRRWRGRLILSLAVGVAIIGASYLAPWRSPESAAAAIDPPAQRSPARELVAKARHLFAEQGDSNRESLLLAEDLLRQAEKLDPVDGEVWAARAQLSGMLRFLGYDTGDERRADLRRQAERAARLAPDSIESHLARVWSLASQPTTLPEAEQVAKDLITRAPGDWRPLILLSQIAYGQRRPQEAVEWLNRAAAFPDAAAVARLEKATLLFIEGRFDAARQAVDESLAIRPLGRALLLKIRGQVLWEGDLDGARESVARVAPSLLLEDQGAFNAFRVWLWRREPERALTLLRGFSRDFLEDVQFTGPKAVLTAAAQTLAGRPDAALPEWELGLRLIDERLRLKPSQSRLLYLRTLCLIELGRLPETEEALRRFRQTDSRGYQQWPGGGTAGLLVKLGRRSEALEHLELEQRHGIALFNSRAVLALNPDFDPLRTDPRFQDLLARAPGPGGTAPPAP